MGDEESVVMDRPFQSMNAVLRTRAKFRIWVKSWRGWREVREENIVKVLCGVDGMRGWCAIFAGGYCCYGDDSGLGVLALS